MKQKLLLFSLVLVFTWIGFNQLQAQNVQVKSSIDTTRMLIGDQVNVLLELDQPKNLEILFPIFRDTLVNLIEILELSPIDTVETATGQLHLSQRLLITSFDTGFYVIPSFYFVNKSTLDSIRTKALPLEVLTLEIDTTKGIADIKLPFEAPLTFMELLPYIVVGLLLVGLIILFVYLRKKRKKIPETVPIRTKPVEPAHLWALRNLDDLAKQKLWQKGKVKLYHSRLAEIVRAYLEYRFSIQAKEETTAETLRDCERIKEFTEERLGHLRNLLELADLVKFAKWNPLPDEHENSLELAYKLVLETKLVQDLRKETKEEEAEHE